MATTLARKSERSGLEYGAAGHEVDMWGLPDEAIARALDLFTDNGHFKYAQRREFENGRVLVSEIYYTVISLERALTTHRRAFENADPAWLERCAADLRDQYKNGTAVVWAFSELEPTGEFGLARYGDLLQLTRERFFEAMECGWRPGPLEPHHIEAPGFFAGPEEAPRPKSRTRKGSRLFTVTSRDLVRTPIHADRPEATEERQQSESNGLSEL